MGKRQGEEASAPGKQEEPRVSRGRGHLLFYSPRLRPAPNSPNRRRAAQASRPAPLRAIRARS